MVNAPTLNRDRVASYAHSGSYPPAVVCDASFVNGLTAIRSLGRMGVPVLAVDHRPSALGFRSRYAMALRSPDPGTETGAYIAFLGALGDAIGRPADHSTRSSVNAIGTATGSATATCTVPRPGDAAARPEQARAAGARRHLGRRRAGDRASPIARGLADGDRIGYPLLVKPSNPDGFRRHFHRQAFRCESPTELERAFADAEPFEPMVQELIPGGDDELYTVGSYIAADGTVLGLFSGRKLRQSPQRGHMPCG